jgi:hypothetical protein
MAAVSMYVALGLQLRLVQIEPELKDEDGQLWLIRVALTGLSVVSLLVVGLMTRLHQRPPGEGRHWLVRIVLGRDGTVSVAILRVAFIEAIGVYGLLLFILGGHLADLFAFCGVSLAALAWYFPTRRRWARELGPKG